MIHSEHNIGKVYLIKQIKLFESIRTKKIVTIRSVHRKERIILKKLKSTTII